MPPLTDLLLREIPDAVALPGMDVLAAMEAGCDAFLHKRVSTRTLPETLRAVVESAENDRTP